MLCEVEDRLAAFVGSSEHRGLVPVWVPPSPGTSPLHREWHRYSAGSPVDSITFEGSEAWVQMEDPPGGCVKLLPLHRSNS